MGEGESTPFLGVVCASRGLSESGSRSDVPARVSTSARFNFLALAAFFLPGDGDGEATWLAVCLAPPFLAVPAFLAPATFCRPGEAAVALGEESLAAAAAGTAKGEAWGEAFLAAAAAAAAGFGDPAIRGGDPRSGDATSSLALRGGDEGSSSELSADDPSQSEDVELIVPPDRSPVGGVEQGAKKCGFRLRQRIEKYSYPRLFHLSDPAEIKTFRRSPCPCVSAPSCAMQSVHTVESIDIKSVCEHLRTKTDDVFQPSQLYAIAAPPSPTPVRVRPGGDYPRGGLELTPHIPKNLIK